MICSLDRYIRNVSRLSSGERWLLMLVWIYFFHIFRNISLIAYVVVMGFVYIIAFAKNVKNICGCKTHGLLETIFILSYTLIMIITLFSGLSFEELFSSISRFIIVYAIFVLFLSCRDRLSGRFVELAYYSYVIFIVLSALSLFYQMFFGPIPFLAEASSREGLIRYASLCGSLTAYGTMGPIGLILLIYKRELFTKIEYILYSFIILGAMFISLQKAAMVNLALVIGWFVLSKLKKEKVFYKKFWITIIFAGIFILLVGVIFNPQLLFFKYITTAVNYVLFENHGSDVSTDISPIADFYQRLTSLPMRVYNFNNMSPSNFVFGIGLKAMSGTVGLDSYPQCHNNFFEMIFTGGLLYLVSFIGLFFRAYKNSHKSSMVLMIIIFATANMLIGAFIISQPVLGVFLALLLIADKNVSNDIHDCRLLSEKNNNIK